MRLLDQKYKEGWFRQRIDVPLFGVCEATWLTMFGGRK